MASIKRNFFYNILLNVTNVIFPLITAPYVARVLDPDGLGLANFANSYAAYFMIFAALGSRTYGYREVAKLRDNPEKISVFTSEIFSLTGINTLFVSAVYIISIFIIPKLEQNLWIFLVSGFILYLTPLKLDWYFIGQERLGVITSRSVIIRIISTLCLFIFVHSKDDLVIYVLLNVISSIGGIVWNLIMLRKDNVRLRFSFIGVLGHYKPILILFISSAAVTFSSTLDSLMMGFLSSYQEVGYYTSASTLSKTLLAVVTSLSAVAVPRVAYYFKHKDYKNINSLINKSLNIVAFLSVPMAFGLACIAPRFTTLFLGPSFKGAILPMILLASLLILTGLNNITGMQVLIGMGLDKFLVYCQIVGICVHLVLNFIWIPTFGADGAAVASLIGELLILILTIGVIKFKTTLKMNNGFEDFWKAIVSSVIFIPVTIVIFKFTSGWTSVILDIIFCSLLYCVIQKLLRSKSYIILEDLVMSKISGIASKHKEGDN